MRIIAGTHKGRRIEAPAGARVRPTYDRVRASVFDILAPDIPGARVLDLFAGSGALGIECLSRGACSATFVDRDRNVEATLKANLERLGLAESAVVLRGDALRFLRGRIPGGPFDIVFVDPPYGTGIERDTLRALASWDGLSAECCIVVEHATGDAAGPDVGPIMLSRSERYGRTQVDFLRVGAREKEAA